MAAPNAQASGVRTHFKTPEGRYKLSREKTYPSGLLHYSHGRVGSQVLLAHLEDRPPAQTNSTNASSSGSTGMRFPSVRLLGAGNGSRALNFVGGNGFTTKLSSGVKSVASGVTSTTSNGPTTVHFDGEGSYVVFNAGDAIFVSNYNSTDKDPIKSIHFTSSNPVCLAFDSEAKDGHDLLIGLSSGDVFSASLRLQLQDSGKKLIGATHFNKDGSLNSSRCTAISWIPNSEGLFVVAHADGNLFVYDKAKDANGDASFPPVKDQAQFSVAHAKSSKSNPVLRWHICQGSINGLSFSIDGMHLATVGRDGYLRIFDYVKEQLICGTKSYFGALLCCSFSLDGKYVLTGGEDDLVQVWSMEDRAVVAWGEGHSSWVTGVAFDPYWATPSDSGESVTYRFGSVGQDTQLLLWDLAMDEVVMPLRRLTSLSASPSRVGGTGPASSWESTHSSSVLLPSPLRKEIPKLAPVMAHRVDLEPLSGLVFSKESILTACHEGHIKVWDRPSRGGSSPSSSDGIAGNTIDGQVSKNGNSHRKS